MWEYRCRVLRVVDGDTLDVEIDVGFHGRQIERLRLLGVDTPERGQEGWKEATGITTLWVNAFPTTEWPFIVRTQKSDSFGRYLAELQATNGESLNDMLIVLGYGRKTP